MGTAEIRDYLLGQGVFAAYTTPEEAGQTIRRELAFWTKVVKDANIKPD